MFRDDCKLPLVAAAEDTGPFTRALVHAEPGKTLLAFREQMSMHEYAETWGRTLNVKTRHTRVGEDERWVDMPGMPDDLRIDLEEGMAYVNEFGFAGGNPSVVHPSDVSKRLQIDREMEADQISSVTPAS